MKLVSIGECLVELSRSDDRRFDVAWAGDAVNTLFYASRLGMECGFISAVGDDLFTPMIVSGLEDEKIDTTHVLRLKDHTNGIYAIDLDDDGEYTFHYWRKDSAATATLLESDIDELARYVSDARYLLFTGVTLGVMKSPERLVELLEHVGNRATIVFDTNYRPQLWPSPREYRRRVSAVMPYVDIFLPTRTDLEATFPENEVDYLLNLPQLTVMKLGAGGCCYTEGDERHYVDAHPVDRVVDTSGAGDAFNAGFLTGHAGGLSLNDACHLGNRVASHVLGIRGAIDANFGAEAGKPGG